MTAPMPERFKVGDRVQILRRLSVVTDVALDVGFLVRESVTVDRRFRTPPVHEWLVRIPGLSVYYWMLERELARIPPPPAGTAEQIHPKEEA